MMPYHLSAESWKNIPQKIAHQVLGQLQRQTGLVLLAMLGLALLYFALRMRGLFPQVFADELIYSTSARLQDLDQALLPSYLYFGLFSATNACGPAFLSCARIGNVMLFLAAAPFVYATATLFCTRLTALAITGFYLFSPMGTYTYYFMPEAMYCLGAWIVIWYSLSRQGAMNASYGAVLGVLLGLLALIKVHALFIIPALCALMLWAGWRGRKPVSCVLAILALLSCFVAVRLGVGYALGGVNGLSFFGTFYSAGAQSASRWAKLLVLLPPALVSAKGHFLGLALLFPLPCLLLAGAFVRRQGEPVDATKMNAAVGALLLFAAPLGLTVLFTALTAEVAREGLRLHFRYYSYALPLLLMLAAAGGANAEYAKRLSVRAILAGIAIAVSAFALRRIQQDYLPNFIDSPELAAFYAVKPDAMVVWQSLLLVGWIWLPLQAYRIYFAAFLPLLTAYLVSGLQPHMNNMQHPIAADLAGIHAREHVPKEQRDRIALVGSDLSRLMRAKFQLDNPNVQLFELAEGEPVDRSLLGRNTGWLLVLGAHDVPDDVSVMSKSADYTFAKVDNSYRELFKVDMNLPLSPGGPVSAVEGTGGTETWGAWSVADQVVIRLRDPAPANLHLILHGRAFGPNVNRDFVVKVGDSVGHFRMGEGGFRDATVRFKTDGLSREIILVVPKPTSPASVGESADGRTLGVALTQIVVGTPGS